MGNVSKSQSTLPVASPQGMDATTQEAQSVFLGSFCMLWCERLPKTPVRFAAEQAGAGPFVLEVGLEAM